MIKQPNGSWVFLMPRFVIVAIALDICSLPSCFISYSNLLSSPSSHYLFLVLSPPFKCSVSSWSVKSTFSVWIVCKQLLEFEKKARAQLGPCDISRNVSSNTPGLRMQGNDIFSDKTNLVDKQSHECGLMVLLWGKSSFFDQEHSFSNWEHILMISCSDFIMFSRKTFSSDSKLPCALSGLLCSCSDFICALRFTVTQSDFLCSCSNLSSYTKLLLRTLKTSAHGFCCSHLDILLG